MQVENQPTSILFIVPSCSFHDYMVQHRLLWSEVAHAAGVPVIVVWSIDHSLIISPEHAGMVRFALQKITGVPFTGPIQVRK